MKLRKRVALRVVAGLLLLVLAAGASVLIRDGLARRNPDDAAPEIKVYMNGVQIPVDRVGLFSYTWRFLGKPYSATLRPAEEYVLLESSYVDSGALLEIEFSYPGAELEVWFRPEVEGAPFEKLNVENGITAPTVPGAYAYRVWGGWGRRGEALYFFRIEVPLY